MVIKFAHLYCILFPLACGPLPGADEPLDGGGVVLAECDSADDCPGGADYTCDYRICESGRCVTMLAEAGTPAALLGEEDVDDVPGDCKIRVCDGRGSTALIADDTDVGGQFDACSIPVCHGGVPELAPAAAGTMCFGPDACCRGRCDGAGACLRGACIGTDDECTPDPSPLPPGTVDVCDSDDTRLSVCAYERYP